MRRWLLALFLAASLAGSQEMAVPVETQVPLLIKILSYDRNLKARAGERIVVAVLFQAKFRESLNAKNGFATAWAAAAPADLLGLPLEVVAIDLEAVADLKATLASVRASVLYITPLRALPLAAVVEAARAQRSLTLTGVASYVQQGLTVGIGERGGRPSILVNLAAAEGEGAKLSAELLKVAEIVSRAASSE